MTMTGTLPPNVNGVVWAAARWGAGPWLTLATTQSVDGEYRLRYQLARAGIVHVRVALPDGDFAVTTIAVDPATPTT